MASITKKEIFLVTGLCLCLFVPYLVHAQDPEREKLRELEKQREYQKSRAITARMDSAIELMNRELYNEADEKLRSVLANVKSVPSDLAYYFGKNSYHLEKYKQSVDWLTKYIQLKGTSGQYSEDAAIFLKKAESGLLQQRQVDTSRAVEVLSRDFTIDCGPAGKVLCPVCNGSTVVVRKDYLSEKYSTCGYCSKTGQLSCDDYNKLIRGQLKPPDENK